jgi:hypothetical protein
MQVRELIRLLQEADPTGDEQVSVGNSDIHFVGVEPGYWDGCLQVLKRDDACEYYNIVGAEFRSNCKKIVINALSIRDALFNDPAMPVTYDGDYAREHYDELVAIWRKEAQAIKTKVRKK